MTVVIDTIAIETTKGIVVGIVMTGVDADQDRNQTQDPHRKAVTVEVTENTKAIKEDIHVQEAD